ncbi:Uncharacterised protein [Mycobacterium tuberculosis]|nr:Uncharacterised protein [Mycobacterium tuberculosis]COY40381.1 Uncharacterised protein [Mycobacterium tuberculosis]
MLVNSASSPSQSTFRSGSRRCRSSSSATASKARANRGNSAYNCAPMPTHWAPCPGNTNTVFPTDRARPTATPAPDSPAANAANPASRAPRSAPTTTARCSNIARVLTNDHPTSIGSKSGLAATKASSRCA